MATSLHQLLVREFSNKSDLITQARGVLFTIFSDRGKIYVINSKGNKRRLSEKDVHAFFERFNQTGSTSPGTYQDVTFNASYLLASLHELKERGVI
ncbi:TPA_asm: hypothetical protein G0G78_21505 [Salmonella enterica]|nr:hypothetical protein [Salmonella enterica]EAO7618367.1 hypothetical protein [Salmonella enterica]EAQ6819011.1 hypothetical protein [Salmonella enterica]EAU9424757.1 hypothetical protein [Salmonella enterica]MIV18790.1 hypothetical protein [Salmonella enterica]